jgi:hypothetical protein
MRNRGYGDLQHLRSQSCIGSTGTSLGEWGSRLRKVARGMHLPLRATGQAGSRGLEVEARALGARGSYPTGPPALRRREGALEGPVFRRGGMDANRRSA